MSSMYFLIREKEGQRVGGDLTEFATFSSMDITELLLFVFAWSCLFFGSSDGSTASSSHITRLITVHAAIMPSTHFSRASGPVHYTDFSCGLFSDYAGG